VHSRLRLGWSDRKWSFNMKFGAETIPGNFHQAFAMRFDDRGSEFDFDVYNIDLRKYVSVAPGHVFALQAFVYLNRGAPPFWRYAALGGRAHSRGYRKGRYLDHTFVAYQVEYRPHIWRRIGAAVFAGFSDVGDGIGDIDFFDMKPTIGLGTRIRLGGQDGVQAQIDVAFGLESIRFYMSLDEAF
jgi:hypothetical protein